MVSIWDMLYDSLFAPRSAMGKIAQAKNVGQAIFVAALSIILPILVVVFWLKDTDMTTMIYTMIVIKIVASFFVWMIGTAIWHLIAEFFGGRGTGIGLFCAVGFAHLPRIFIIPLWALITVMPEDSKTLLMVIAVLLILSWSLALDVVAIKEVHQLSTTKAFLVMLTPPLIIGLLCLICFIFISSSFMHMSMWV